MAASVFFSDSHVDEALRDQVETQLALLKRQGVIETWHDRRIGAGEEFAGAIEQHVETDDIILLLVSADFIASDHCYDIEMKRAMERHASQQERTGSERRENRTLARRIAPWRTKGEWLPE